MAGGPEVNLAVGSRVISSTDKKQKENRKWGQAMPAPSDVFPSVRLHLLKVPELSRTAPPTGDEVFTHFEIIRGRFLFKLAVTQLRKRIHCGCW